MALNLVSPGVKIREVDLTIGRVESSTDQVGAIVGPFEMGPVNTPILITNEQELISTFGKPISSDGQYEYWLSASNYLSYGGILRVLRSDGSNLNNSNSAVSYASTTVKITSYEDYQNSHLNDTQWRWAAKNPGSWANNLKVCVIDSFADQIITGIVTSATPVNTFSQAASSTGSIGITTTLITGISTTGIQTSQVVRSDYSGILVTPTTVVGIASTSNGLGTITLSNTTLNADAISGITFKFGTVVTTLTGSAIQVGMAVTQSLVDVSYVNDGGTISSFNGYLRGVVTGVGNSSISVKITDRVDSNLTGFILNGEGPISTPIDYKKNSPLNSFATPTAYPLFVKSSNGVDVVSFTAVAPYFNTGICSDWYDQQTLGLSNSTVYWNSVAEKPGTSQYGSERNCKNDEVHVVVVDDTGSVTGVPGNIIEKFVGLSKASDGRLIPSQDNYYKNIIADSSSYVFAGLQESGSGSSITLVSGSTTSYTVTTGVWGSSTQNTKFNVVGAKTYNLSGGTDYSGTNNIGGYQATLANINSGYSIFGSTEYKIDFLINGPSGGSTMVESQAKANSLIAIANQRKDCIAVISPHRSGVINVSNSTTQTDNVITFFEGLTSSSYAVFDSGYKYMFDRFNNKFEYVACNADIAGLMARTSVNNFPWFSPAGAARGALNNVVKLAYNPSQTQRDALYSKRVNPIISSQGAGFILFGDKTALGYASAFDRINVRRLFLTLQSQIEVAARAQLFEFNDLITRTNFINIVDPYLRDVQSKRGITNYVLVCDESNNTPDIIDANQFRADIFVQPARSINYIGLTFVATRTGISFSEVIGNV